MPNQALNRSVVVLMTNKSGNSLAQGDVVVLDTTTAASVTTTTSSAYAAEPVGVVVEPNGIANNATGLVCFVGYVPIINLSGSAGLGDFVKCHSVAKQGVRHATPSVAGDFAMVLGTGATPAAYLFGSNFIAGSGGSGTVTSVASGAGLTGGPVTSTGTLSLSADTNGGWIADANTWSYSSADSPSFVISVNADMTSILTAGMRIRLVQTTTKYFIVTKVGTFGSGVTLVTVYGGTDYTLANAAITVPFYSTAKLPLGFNADPAKWTQTTTDTTAVQQASPVQNTWYNLGSISLVIPIGVWRVSYSAQVEGSKSSGTAADILTTLSTANNSESDTTMTTYALYVGATGSVRGEQAVYAVRTIALTSKTTYYLNAKTDIASQADVNFYGTRQPTIIRAECALL